VVHKPLGTEFIGGVVLLGLGVWGLYINYPTLKQSADSLSSPVAVSPSSIVPPTIPVAPANLTTNTSNPFGDLSLIDPDTIPNIPPPPPGVTWQKDKDAANLYQTGLNYEKGLGVSQNYTTAMDFYQRAATKYDTTAMIGIARLYRTVPAEPNIPVALKWYQKAVSLGDPQAMTEIGVLYQNGIGVTQDFNQAMKWYKPAADAGNADAMYLIGYCYEGGWGVDKDIPTAIDWYRKAVAAGSTDAQRALVKLGIAVNNDSKSAPAPFDPDAFLAKNDSVQDNRDLGLKYLNAAQPNFAEALKWLYLAADKGDAVAQYNIGGMYYNGLGVTKDYSQALSWFQKAAAQGNADAENSIGSMYSFGVGVPQDYSEALKWYQKAVDQNDAIGQYNMGRMYESGSGVTKDIPTAVEWYQKAVRQGNNDAAKDLQRLGRNPFDAFDTSTPGTNRP
jgi:TPR repeat protein